MANKKTSPQGGTNDACLCEDGTYSKECCQGEQINQGIGALVGQSTSTVVNTNQPRTVVSGS